MADPAYPAEELEQLGHAYRWVSGRENHAKAAAGDSDFVGVNRAAQGRPIR